MRPLLFFFVYGVALTTTLAKNDDQITVHVGGLPAPGDTSPRGIADYRVLEEFRHRNPDVNLQPSGGLRIEGLGTEIGPLLKIAGGISPDVLYVNFRKVDTYVRQGILYPLDEFIEREMTMDPSWKSRLLPQVEPVIQRPGLDGVAHYFALPTSYGVMGLYFNRPVFQAAGLPDRAPRTWDELVGFSRKINALGPEYKALLLNNGQSASWNLMNFLWSTGAEAVEEIAPNDWRAVFNSEGAIEAFEFYYRLTEGEHLAFRDNVPQFLKTSEGRFVGMTFGSVGEFVAEDPNIWGFGAVPAGPEGIRGSEINAAMFGIFSGVKDPRVREAAWRYINFLGSEDAQRIRVTTMLELGMVNQINPADLRKFGYTAQLELADRSLEEEFKSAMASSKPEPYGKNCDLIYLEMTYPLDQILLSPLIAEAWADGNRDAVRAEIKRILDASVAATNERMLGLVPPEKMAERRLVAWGVAALILAAFVGGGIVIFRTFSQAGAASARARGVQKIYAWGMLLIPILLTLVWNYVPVLRGAWMALLDYKLLLPSTFVGIDNFANILYDPRFWQSLLATFHFAFWMLTFGFVAPIVLAYLLHVVPRHKLIFRSLYYLPALLTGAALYVLWKQFFSVNGLINQLLAGIGIFIPRAWPEDPTFAMLACVLPAIWAGAGPGCLIYLAALKTLPEEQFEASEIDGAGFWSKTLHIVLPGLKPLIIINFVGAVVGAFQSSQNVLIMTGGGPNGMTEVAALRIFYQAFMFLQFGPATAMAWILGSLLIGFTLIQLRSLSRMEFKGASS